MISFDIKSVQWGPSARMDLCAVGLSTLCVLHCVALPVLAALMPLAAQAAESELVHRILVIAAVPVSLRVIWKTLPAAGNRLFVGAAVVGLGLLLLAAFVEAVSSYEEPITIAGGSLLGLAHLWNCVRQCGNG
ncbi:MAG: MerC domain-containing protein [Gammaproteobacteria bacterium]|nr:MerC domain-containing protein [Gammaproteobacteria bacterium]MYF67608.1 MerC domain-containing protein [Gammaproteobacteria bacterium]MYK36171.1 MerC domain-containing protein [Gammaproteobacteria bacterium]